MEVLRRLSGREQTVAGIEASANKISPQEGPSSVDIRSNNLFQVGLRVATRVAFVAAMLVPSAAVELIQPTSVKASTEISDPKENKSISNDIGEIGKQGEIIRLILEGEFGTEIIEDLFSREIEVDDSDHDDGDENEVGDDPQVDAGIGGYKLTGIGTTNGEIIRGILEGVYGPVDLFGKAGDIEVNTDSGSGVIDEPVR